MRRFAVAALVVLGLLLPPAGAVEPSPEEWDRWQSTGGGNWTVAYNLSRDWGLLLADGDHPGLPGGLGATMPWIQFRTTDPSIIADWERFGRPQETTNRWPLGENLSKYNRAGEGGQNMGGNWSRVTWGVNVTSAGIHFWQEKIFFFLSPYPVNETPVPGDWARVDYWLNATPPFFTARINFYFRGSNPSSPDYAIPALPLRLAFPAGQPYAPSGAAWQPVANESNATLPAGAMAGVLIQGRGVVVESDRPAQVYWLRDRPGELIGPPEGNYYWPPEEDYYWPPEGDYYWPPWMDNESLSGEATALWLLVSFREEDDWERMGEELWRLSFNVTLRSELPDLTVAPVTLPEPLWDGLPVALPLTVTNRGPGGSAPTVLAADWGAGNRTLLAVPALAPGASHALTLAFTPSLAHPWLNLTVDPGNAQLEDDEANNFRAVPLPVRERLPDFTITLEVSHHAVLEGQPLEATVTVANVGNRESDEWVNVRLDYSRSEGVSTAFPLAVGESRSVTWTLELPPGTHRLRAEVDSADMLRELDEENNVAELEVTVVVGVSAVPSFAASPGQLLLAGLVVAALVGWQRREA